MKQNSYSKMKIVARREGQIGMDPAMKEGKEKFLNFKSLTDNYQCPYSNGRAYQHTRAYQETAQYKPPTNKLHIRDQPWWVQTGPVIPNAQILNEQPVTNLLNPNEMELQDINKLQAMPYGSVMNKNRFIQTSIKTMDNVHSHELIHSVKPFEKQAMADLIYSRRNNLPAFKAEQIFNEKMHYSKNKTMLKDILPTKRAYQKVR